MRHRAQHQNAHGAIQKVQRIAARIEEQDIAQTQRQPGHRHGQRGHAMQPLARTRPARGLGHQIGAQKLSSAPTTAVAAAMVSELP
jgi:hypothetical protein